MNNGKLILVIMIVFLISSITFSDEIQADNLTSQITPVFESGSSFIKPIVKKTHKKKSFKENHSGSALITKDKSDEDDYSKYVNGEYTSIDQKQEFGDSSTLVTGDTSFSMSFNQFNGSKVKSFQLESGSEIIFYTNSKIAAGDIKIGFINLDTNSKIGDIEINKKTFSKFMISSSGNYAYIIVGQNVEGDPAHISVKWKIIPNATQN